jgi:hypothetical protein
MSPSLRALLEGIIDYAGLFPPAKLPLDQSIRNYARFRQEPDGWMLSRFVCPASRLKDLDPLIEEHFTSGPPLVISALGTGGKTTAEYMNNLRDDLKTIDSLRQRFGSQTVVDAFEVRLPSDLLQPGKEEQLRAVVYSPDASLASTDAPPMSLYYEIEYGQGWPQLMKTLIGVLLENANRRKGFKFRTGGMEASAFPSPFDLAHAIAACQAVHVPMKFTAGLHHPLRHFNLSVQTKMHGFINVFVAGVLAVARRLTADQLLPIIEDEDPASFQFDDKGLRWKDHGATVAEITEARKQGVLSFGSCSFDEPREDLRRLGWMDHSCSPLPCTQGRGAGGEG